MTFFAVFFSSSLNRQLPLLSTVIRIHHVNSSFTCILR